MNPHTGTHDFFNEGVKIQGKYPIRIITFIIVKGWPELSLEKRALILGNQGEGIIIIRINANHNYIHVNVNIILSAACNFNKDKLKYIYKKYI